MVKHLLLRALAVLAIAIFSATGYSQSAKLKGKVTDEATKEGLFGVNVMVTSTNEKVKTGTSTDFDGNYEITLPEGSYKVKYNYIGYKNVNETITIIRDIIHGL